MNKGEPGKKKMPVWVWIVAGVFALGLIGSLISSGDSDEEALAPVETAEEMIEEPASATADGDFYINLVEERFAADCFVNLSESIDYRYEEDPGGTLRDGFVYVNAGGDILQFAVGTNPDSGAVLTVPHNEITLELLERAGC